MNAENRLPNLDSQNKDPLLVSLHMAWSSKTCQLGWNDNKNVRGSEKCAPMQANVDFSQQRKSTIQLITKSGKVSNSSLKVGILDSRHYSQPSIKGTSDKQIISVSIVIYEWPVAVPETTRCQGRQDALIKKKSILCQKPVSTAIIEFDLICMIKVFE